MPGCEIIYYCEGDSVPVLDWLRAIPAKTQNKCLAYLAHLESQGHELRRPVADLLQDGIYELRPSHQGIHYRILYFFSGKNVVVISLGLVKDSRVPPAEINRAVARKLKFEANPKDHTFTTPK